MAQLQNTIYTTTYCGDCRRAKQFLKERGMEFREVNIDESQEAEDLVMKVNDERRRVPTFKGDGRCFSCSPYNPCQLAEELNIPLNS